MKEAQASGDEVGFDNVGSEVPYEIRDVRM
jgi:hypothetical protein